MHYRRFSSHISFTRDSQKPSNPNHKAPSPDTFPASIVEVPPSKNQRMIRSGCQKPILHLKQQQTVDMFGCRHAETQLFAQHTTYSLLTPGSMPKQAKYQAPPGRVLDAKHGGSKAIRHEILWFEIIYIYIYM